MGNEDFFPVVMQQARGVDQPSHYGVEVEETVELYIYLYSPFVTSWHVKCEFTLYSLTCVFHFCVIRVYTRMIPFEV